MLNEGQYFFTDIEKECILLHDSSNTALAERKPLSAAEAKVVSQQYYEQWYTSGVEFLEGLQFYLSREQHKLAAFMLHQAAERTL